MEVYQNLMREINRLWNVREVKDDTSDHQSSWDGWKELGKLAEEN